MTAVVVTAGLFWLAVFAILFAAQGSSPVELLWGRYETPPDDLGIWKEIESAVGAKSANGHLLREERYLLPGGRAGASHLLHQVRYRDPVTQAIGHVAVERSIPRRRSRVRSP